MARKLNIKNLVPRKNGHFRQGYFVPCYPEKYIGDANKIIFRSGYEHKFATFCDTNDGVIAWSSETVQVPYVHPIEKIVRPYNIDFYVKIRQQDNTYKEYIVEVKPAKQLKAPQAPTGAVNEKRILAYHTQVKNYLINLAKFNAAKAYAKDRGWEFVVVTEVFLFN